MIKIGFITTVKNLRVEKLLHGGLAVVICAALLTALVVLIAAVFQPKITTLAQLKTRAESIEALEEALQAQNQALKQRLQLIGVDHKASAADLEFTETRARLNKSADDLIETLEARGFTLIERNDPIQRQLTATLGAHAQTLRFTGPVEAVATLLSQNADADPYIASLNINANLTAPNDRFADFSIEIERIGALKREDEPVQ